MRLYSEILQKKGIFNIIRLYSDILQRKGYKEHSTSTLLWKLDSRGDTTPILFIGAYVDLPLCSDVGANAFVTAAIAARQRKIERQHTIVDS